MSHEQGPQYADLLEQAKEVHAISEEAGRSYGRHGRYGESWSLADRDNSSQISTNIKTDHDTYMPKMVAEIDTHTPSSDAEYTSEMSVRPDYTLDAKTTIKRGDYEFISDDPVFAKKVGEFALKRTGKENTTKIAYDQERDNLHAVEEQVRQGEATANEVRQVIEAQGFSFRGNEPIRPVGDRRPQVGKLRQRYGKENVYSGMAFDTSGKPLRGYRSLYVRAEQEQPERLAA